MKELIDIGLLVLHLVVLLKSWLILEVWLSNVLFFVDCFELAELACLPYFHWRYTWPDCVRFIISHTLLFHLGFELGKSQSTPKSSRTGQSVWSYSEL